MYENENSFEEAFDEAVGRAENDHFVIEDDQTAEWAIQQIKNAKANVEKWKAFYEERLQIIKNDAELTIANMESLLQTYFQKVPHKVTDTQESYPLPGGKLVFKRQAPEYRREDADVIAWLKEHDGQKYVKVKEQLDWDSLRKNINVIGDTVSDEHGEIMPIKVVAKPNIFKIELKKEQNNVSSKDR